MKKSAEKVKKEKKTPLSYFKDTISRTCYIFTAVTLIMCATAAMFSSEKTLLMPSTVCLVFAFAFAISLSSLTYTTMKFWPAHILNFFVLGIIWYLFVTLPKVKSNGVNQLVAIFIYVAVFVIVTAVILIVRGKKKRRITDLKEYESKF